MNWGPRTEGWGNPSNGWKDLVPHRHFLLCEIQFFTPYTFSVTFSVVTPVISHPTWNSATHPHVRSHGCVCEKLQLCDPLGPLLKVSQGQSKLSSQWGWRRRAWFSAHSGGGRTWWLGV